MPSCSEHMFKTFANITGSFLEEKGGNRMSYNVHGIFKTQIKELFIRSPAFQRKNRKKFFLWILKRGQWLWFYNWGVLPLIAMPRTCYYLDPWDKHHTSLWNWNLFENLEENYNHLFVLKSTCMYVVAENNWWAFKTKYGLKINFYTCIPKLRDITISSSIFWRL